MGGACTKQNPRSCADGVCNDIAFPFCDVDGTLEGDKNTCIAVSCNPGELAACRGDEAITCNAMGSNYDVTQCERGCDETSGGCTDCTNNDQCPGSAPICDSVTHVCRGCTLDTECASQVCDLAAGTCLAESVIVYASSMGGTSGSCALAEPCALPRAVAVSTTAAVTPTLRLLPGNYNEQLKVATPTASTLKVVGTGATVAPMNIGKGVEISGGANVEIRNLTINAADALVCEDATLTSALTVIDSGGSGAIGASRCMLRLTRVDLTASAVTLTGPTELQADRVRVVGSGQNTTFGLFGQSVTSRVTNSIFEDVALSPNTIDAANPGSQISFAFSTFIFTGDGEHDCLLDSGAAHRTVLFENNVMKSVGPSGLDVIAGATCTVLHNILFPQTVAPASNLNVDPQLVDITGHDFHLKSTSPAVDAAVPSAGLDPASDFDGVSRPQGAKKDIGAFELKP